MISTSQNDILNRVLSVVAEVLSLEKSKIDIDSSIPNGLAPDSLDQVRLYMTLEDEFESTIPEEELEKIETLRDVVNYIEQALRK